MTMSNEMQIVSRKWKENILNCRTCKRNLVVFLGQYFLHHSSSILTGSQRLYIAGTFKGDIVDTAWYMTGTNDPEHIHAMPRRLTPGFSCTLERTAINRCS